MSPNAHLLVALFGRADRRQVVVVTASGVELPLGRAFGWTVAAVAQTLTDIAGLPETEERS